METIAIVGDTHANSRMGLCVPTFNLLDGGTYRANKTQRWLWTCWLDFWEEFASLGGRKGAIFNGDMVDGDTKNRTHQVITRNQAEMVGLAQETLVPALDVLDYCIFLKGTPAHVGKSAQLEEDLASDTTISKKNGSGNYAWDRFYGMVGGVIFDVKHFGKLGYKYWTRPNALNSIATELILAYVKNGERLPHVAVRNHRHQKGDTYDNYAIRVIANGCWQGPTEYAQIISDELPDIMGLIYQCEDGKYKLIKKIYPFPKRRLWKISV